MAAFSLTSSGVKAGSGAQVRTVNSNETHVAGQAITSDGYIVDPDDSAKLAISGISVAAATSSGEAVLVVSGDLIVTDTLVPQRQIICAPSGQLQYDEDLLSGDYYVIVGFTKDINTITIDVNNPTVLKA